MCKILQKSDKGFRGSKLGSTTSVLMFLLNMMCLSLLSGKPTLTMCHPHMMSSNSWGTLLYNPKFNTSHFYVGMKKTTLFLVSSVYCSINHGRYLILYCKLWPNRKPTVFEHAESTLCWAVWFTGLTALYTFLVYRCFLVKIGLFYLYL